MGKISGKQIALNTDPNLGLSNDAIASQYAIKQYVDTKVAEASAVIYTFTITQATVSPAVINHNLNTFNYITTVYDSVTGEDVVVNVDRVSPNTVQVSYGTLDNDLTFLIFAGDGSLAGTSGIAVPNPQSNEVGLEIITNASFNATTSSHFLHYNHNTAGTIYLPSTPKFGQQIIISDMTGNGNINNITINGNGKLINGSSNAIINTSYGSIMLIYNNTNWIGSAFTS